MMTDDGASSKISNDVLNEFKKGFTDKLAKCDNIITIGATNLEINEEKALLDGKTLDKPMLDRFALKINVPSPDSKQIQETILNNYKSATAVDSTLKQKNSELQVFSDFLSKNKISFRTLNSIFQQTAARTAIEDSNVSLKELVKTVNSLKEELNLNINEIEDLCLNMKLNPSEILN